MQELFEKIAQHLPAFLGNMIELLTKPKHFLVSHARADDGLSDGLIFLSIAGVLSMILASPFLGFENLVQATILLVVAGVIVFAVAAALFVVSWKLVGGKATPQQQMVMLAYQAAPIVLLNTVVMVMTWPNLTGLSLDQAAVIVGDWSRQAMAITAAGSFLWTIVSWGAYRVVNDVPRSRSVAAFVVVWAMGIPVNLLGVRLGTVLGWNS